MNVFPLIIKKNYTIQFNFYFHIGQMNKYLIAIQRDRKRAIKCVQ